jgi:hypothetical protein
VAIARAMRTPPVLSYVLIQVSGVAAVDRASVSSVEPCRYAGTVEIAQARQSTDRVACFQVFSTRTTLPLFFWTYRRRIPQNK